MIRNTTNCDSDPVAHERKHGRGRRIAEILAFSWAHAVMIKDRKQAEALLQKAPSMSIPKSAIESMRTQQELELPPSPLTRVAPIALAVVAFGGIGLFLWLRRKREEGTAESAA